MTAIGRALGKTTIGRALGKTAIGRALGKTTIGRAIALGDAASAAHDWPAAERAYSYALDADPTLAHIWVQYGHALKEQGYLEGAIAAYNRAIALIPDLADTHLQLGHALKLQGRRDDARKAYGRALELDPDLMDAAHELQRLDRELQSAAVITQPSPAAADWISRGDAASAAHDWPTAAMAYENALGRNPTLAHIWVQYGHALKEQRDYVRAEAAYRRSIDLAPEVGDTHLQLGHLLKTVGRREAAIAAYEAALIAPDSRADARRELFALGEQRHLHAAAEDGIRAGRMDLIAVVADEVAHLRATLDRIAGLLPEATARAAWPPALYARYRELHALPPPPALLSRAALDVVLLLDGSSADIVWRQLHGLFDQNEEDFVVHAVGEDPAALRIIGQIAAAYSRLHQVPAHPGEGPAAQLERTLSLGNTEWVVLLARGAVPDRRALAWFAVAAMLQRHVSAWICDEELLPNPDRGDLGSPVAPEFRQAPDYDWLLDLGSRGQTLLVRRDALTAALARYDISSVDVLRTAILLDLSRDGRVGHIPLPLVQRGETTKTLIDEHIEAVRCHAGAHGFLDRLGGLDEAAAVPLGLYWRPRRPAEPITVIVATRDNADDLAGLVRSLRTLAADPSALRFLIIDNGSTEPAAVSGLASLAAAPDVDILEIDEPFNWSRLNNLAARRATTPLIAFLNDDMTMITAGWDARLRGLLDREEVGIVGALLLYPNDTIQHAGILFDWRGSTIHDGLHEPRSAAGPDCRWQVTRSVSAVTGAFLGIRTERFLELGGFDDLYLPVAHSDVDLALKVRRTGLKVIWTPQIALYHHESKTRGLDHLDPERHARGNAELAAMRKRWKQILDIEPSMSPAWTRTSLPFRLLSAPAVDKVLAHMKRSAGGFLVDPNTGSAA